MIASVLSTVSANQRFYGDLNSCNTPPRSGRSIKVALPFYCLRVETCNFRVNDPRSFECYMNF